MSLNTQMHVQDMHYMRIGKEFLIEKHPYEGLYDFLGGFGTYWLKSKPGWKHLFITYTDISVLMA